MRSLKPRWRRAGLDRDPRATTEGGITPKPVQESTASQALVHRDVSRCLAQLGELGSNNLTLQETA